MKKTLLCLLIYSCATGVWANAQNVSYKIVKDDPYSSNLHICFLPFYVDLATKDANLSIGYGFQASLICKKKATFNVYLERPYSGSTDFGYHFSTVGIYSSPTVNIPKKFLHLELGGTFHLKDNLKERQSKVVLHSTSGNRYTYTTFIMVPATIRKITGARAGLYTYHTAITANQNGTVMGDLGGNGVISTDGTHFGGAANLNSAGIPEDPFFNTESATNMRVVGGYIGISSSSYHKVIIEADGYGKKGLGRFINLYADFLFAPVSIDPFEGKDGKIYDVSGNGAQGFDTRPLGARLGYEYSMVKKKVGMYVKTEMGIKPGLANSKFYCVLAWGITFNTKIKKLVPETN